MNQFITDNKKIRHMPKLLKEQAVFIVTIHDACPAFSKKIFSFTNLLEDLGINYNIAIVPFFNERQDLPRFPRFVERVKKCKGEIALHGLYHKKANGQLDDFHTRSRAITEVEIRAGLQIFDEIGVNTKVFVPPSWRLSTTSTKVLQKLGFRLAEIQEKFILISSRGYKRLHVTKVLSWDSYGNPRKNVINIVRNKRHFNSILQNRIKLVRIALHPADPPGSLKDQKEMIVQLKDLKYKALRYSELMNSPEKA